jgi:hypothetical protein
VPHGGGVPAVAKGSWPEVKGTTGLIPLLAAVLILTVALLNIRYAQDKDDLAGKGVRARLAVRARRHPLAFGVQGVCLTVALLLYVGWGIATWIG